MANVISNDDGIRNARPFRAALLRWYDKHKRPLPWRKTRDPYRIWVSEIMLQQTRVAAVLNYYRQFLSVFPNVASLARADEQDVLAQWSGLGYYRRARMLHAAAKKLAAERRRIPRTSAALRELPGIGRYTAAAIASIAFGEVAAVVDGNVERVLLRMAGGSAAPDFQARAQELIDTQRPGDFNQAMMELGATVCAPRNPRCQACPLKKWCVTRGEHAAAATKARGKKEIGYALVTEGKTIVLEQRAKNSHLMPLMWELPQIEPPFPRTIPLLKLRHSITTTDYSVRVWHSNSHHGNDWVQLKLSQAEKLPLTGLTKKILKRLSLTGTDKSIATREGHEKCRL